MAKAKKAETAAPGGETFRREIRKFRKIVNRETELAKDERISDGATLGEVTPDVNRIAMLEKMTKQLEKLEEAFLPQTQDIPFED